MVSSSRAKYHDVIQARGHHQVNTTALPPPNLRARPEPSTGRNGRLLIAHHGALRRRLAEAKRARQHHSARTTTRTRDISCHASPRIWCYWICHLGVMLPSVYPISSTTIDRVPRQFRYQTASCDSHRSHSDICDPTLCAHAAVDTFAASYLVTSRHIADWR